MKYSMKHFMTAVVVLAIASAVVVAFLPEPVPVDVATVERGLLRVTVDEDGKTRIRDRYIVSTPLAGRLLRITLEPGDEIERGSTLLASVEPVAPTLLDSRTLEEAEAKYRASQAALNRAEPLLI